MSESLESLVRNLGNNLRILDSFFDEATSSLLKQKGVFPYEWWDDPSKMDATLPPKEMFYSKLTGKDIEDKDYTRAQ